MIMLVIKDSKVSAAHNVVVPPNTASHRDDLLPDSILLSGIEDDCSSPLTTVYLCISDDLARGLREQESEVLWYSSTEVVEEGADTFQDSRCYRQNVDYSRRMNRGNSC